MAASDSVASRVGTFGVVTGLVVVFGALLVGTTPLGDNSFLTHLATGRLILDLGHVPTADPYSFTAPDAPWVVQSWLASVIYAGLERLAGGLGLRLLFAALTGAMGFIIWRLTRPAQGVIIRLGLAGVALLVGNEMWSERPLLLGLVFFGVLALACETPLPGPFLAVIGWLWVNCHGSFPLGLVLVGLLAMGRRLDGEEPRLELRALRWTGGGMLLGAVNPVGPKLLLFPFDLLERQEVLRSVIEWQAPSFQTTGQRAFLVLLAAAMVSLVRRPRWRSALPMIVFTVAGLLAARNIALASIVLVATAAPSWTGIGSITGNQRVRHGVLVAGAFVVIAGAIVAGRLSGEAYALEHRYPLQALALLEQRDVGLTEERMVTPDVVGNLLTAVGYEGRAVYVDDRFDMYPPPLMEGYLGLLGGAAGWRDELDSVGADLVVWRRSEPLSQLLAVDPQWATVLLEDGWATYCRRGSGINELGC